MAKTRIVPVVAALLALSAATLSSKLLTKHLKGSSGSAWFEAGCSDAEGRSDADCAAVLASPYSYFPPKKENEPKGTGHIPVAFLGLVYYSVLTVWFIGVGRPSYSTRWIHVIPALLVAAGLAASVFFTLVMFTRIDEWCPWCLATHVLNLLIAACVLLMWPRATEATPEPTSSAAGGGRYALITSVAILLVVYGQYQMLGWEYLSKHAVGLEKGFDQCMVALDRFKDDPDALVSGWQKATECSVAVRPDDPVRLTKTEAEQPLEVVVFSDLECPSCRRLAKFLEGEVEPLFGGYLKLVFKHYPLNRDCNPLTATRKHRYACEAAAMAEAARIIDGSDAFWRAHDYIFAHQQRLKLGKLTSAEVAAELGIEPQRLADKMKSETIMSRIREDAEVGRACGVNSTPALFVSGRRVRPPARGEIGFWDRVADLYWESRNEPRPESTKLAKRGKQR